MFDGLTNEQLKNEVQEMDSTRLFIEFLNYLQFDIAKLPVGYEFPEKYNILVDELKERLKG